MRFEPIRPRSHPWPLLLPLALLVGCQLECGGGADHRAERANPAIHGIAMTDETRVAEAAALMRAFAERTGLDSDGEPRRYLWTDAFAVCNYLGLARETGESEYEELARRLVDQVHHRLGRHRADDPRTGWISGLDEAEGEAHPTVGGLRIGKPLPERGPGDPYDQRLEWDRDGQYFHYLTKWMHALDLMTRATGEPVFNRWARELAETAAEAFIYQPDGRGGVLTPRMVWKMSIDLSRPLVPSMGQHDPLDGYVTYQQLRATASSPEVVTDGPELDEEIAVFDHILAELGLTTTDPLGLGGLLMDASRLDALIRAGQASDRELLVAILSAALRGLERYVGSGELERSASQRLAFRELGLAIGLAAVDRMQRAAQADPEPFPDGSTIPALLDDLLTYSPVGDRIVRFWLDPSHRVARTWTEHRDINEVMLATALAPDGCLSL